MSADAVDQPLATDAQATVAIAPGKVLADARTARQMSVADVAQQLKLSVTQVEALEAGEHERLPGPVFVKGFVRNYARLVGANATELLAALELPPSPSAADAVPPSQNVPFEPVSGFNWRPYLILALLLIGALGAYELWRFGMLQQPSAALTEPRPGPTGAMPASSAVAVPAPAVVISQMTAQPGSSVVAGEPSEPVVTQGKEPEKAVIAPAVKPELPASPAPVAEKAVISPAADSGQVVLRFSALSWVEVRDRDDRVLLSQLNTPGSEKHFSGPKPLRLVIGNANAVRMSVAGKPFDLTPHTSLDVAKVILE